MTLSGNVSLSYAPTWFWVRAGGRIVVGDARLFRSTCDPPLESATKLSQGEVEKGSTVYARLSTCVERWEAGSRDRNIVYN